MEDDYRKLVEFWNAAFAMDEEESSESEEVGDPTELAPSPKLAEALSCFKGNDRVLDYGCGGGWASLIMAHNGVKSILAADVAENSLTLLRHNAKAYGLDANIETIHIDETWLSSQKEGAFDGFFCSNVIDVVPLDMAERIIAEAAKSLRKDGIAIIGLNFYADPKAMEARGAKVVGRQVYIDGVLRLTSLTDEEWKERFTPYFEVEDLSYFAWPGEQKETRRLFKLRKK